MTEASAGPKIVPVGGRGWDCNQFLLKDPKSNRFDMVDAGHGIDFQQVLQEVAAVIEPTRVRSIAITHEHLDHVNGLPQWQKLGAKIAASGPCADKLAAGHDPTSAMFGADIPKLTVDEVLTDGDHVSLGGEPFAFLWTPGHSPGSACYWNDASGTLFSGDTVFAQGGIGRYDFPDGHVATLAESILRLESLPVRILHAGHGPSLHGDGEAARSLQGSMANVRSCL